MKNPVMKQAFEAWENLIRDTKKWVEYESRLKAILDEVAFAKEMEIRQQRAEQRAREKGLAEGLAKGMVEGEASEGNRSGEKPVNDGQGCRRYRERDRIVGRGSGKTETATSLTL